MVSSTLALLSILANNNSLAPSNGIKVAVERVETNSPVVALTFDACSTVEQPNGFDRPVWDILQRERIPITVFVTGRWLEYHPDEAREMAAEPWIEFGNHSYSHPRLAGVADGRIVAEITRTEALIDRLGVRSVAFRPPAGIWDDRLVKVAGGRDLPTVLWDVSSGDAGGHLPADQMVQRISSLVRPGSIIIFHINGRGPHTRLALPRVISLVRERGLIPVRLSELFKVPGAKVVPARKMVLKPKAKPRAGAPG
jgi:peptidoglycan-N-acetylglucosamine deacetylase